MRNILFVTAHPDDAELAAGGTIAKFVKEGLSCHILLITGKGSKSYSDKVIRTTEEAEQEQRASADILGVQSVITLGHEDMFVRYDGTLVGEIEKCITEKNIDTVFTHNVVDTHQDHINVAKATLSAARHIHNIFMYEPIAPSGRGPEGFTPNLYIDISEFIEIKMISLKSHASQLAKYGSRWLRGVESRAGYRGFEIDCEYAECFEVVRYRLNDK